MAEDRRAAVPVTTPGRPLRVAFLHPELGIGGSERLVLDAARHLQAVGHHVTVFTTRRNRRASVESSHRGLDIRVHGEALPRDVFDRLRAPAAIARMAYLSVAALARRRVDVVFCDLVAHVLPLVRRLTTAPVVFYCHFPDRLLVERRRTWYRWYRTPIDASEAAGMASADCVLVNSRFTETAVRRLYPRLAPESIRVLCPGVDVGDYTSMALAGPPAPDVGDILLLSVSRFAPPKNLDLALGALTHLRRRIPRDTFARVRLVFAGGYDSDRGDDRATLQSLQAQAVGSGLDAQVTFVTSCSESERLDLLARCRTVVYTPVDEHFGFVPLEAMAAARPVVATESGGPLETIEHGRTGYLCPPTPDAFADALARLIRDPIHAARMGAAGREHVAERFSLDAFGRGLDAVITDLRERT